MDEQGEQLEAWEDARVREADEVGSAAQFARKTAIAALKAGDANLARNAAIVYGIFVDKANVMAGKPRVEHKASRQDRDQLLRKVSELREKQGEDATRRKPRRASA